MKLTLRVEELIQFLASIVILVQMDPDISWWWWPILFLAPDIGMIGYLINTKVGAWTYNLCHHKGIALLIIAFGYFSYSNNFLIAGIILFGHSAMDRTVGYGMKYTDSFKHTHLGTLK